MGEREGGSERERERESKTEEKKEGKEEKRRKREGTERDRPMQEDEMGFNKESEPLGPGGPQDGLNLHSHWTRGQTTTNNLTRQDTSSRLVLTVALLAAVQSLASTFHPLLVETMGDPLSTP